MYMLAEAMKQAKSTDPLKVAQALEGMNGRADTGDVEMRATDHQLIQPLYISTCHARPTAKVAEGVKYDVEDTGFGFKTDVAHRSATSRRSRPPAR